MDLLKNDLGLSDPIGVNWVKPKENKVWVSWDRMKGLGMLPTNPMVSSFHLLCNIKQKNGLSQLPTKAWGIFKQLRTSSFKFSY